MISSTRRPGLKCRELDTRVSSRGDSFCDRGFFSGPTCLREQPKLIRDSSSTEKRTVRTALTVATGLV